MLNNTLLQKYNSYERNLFARFPDFLPYDFSVDEYHRYLEQTLNQTQGYLMVDDFGLKRVGIFRYLWESFTGWFGFKNGCDAKRTQMQALKLIYWGYLKGFFTAENAINIKTLSETMPYLQEIADHVKRPLNINSSSIFQAELLRYFSMNEDGDLKEYLYNQGLPGAREYRFGQIYLFLNELRSLVEIDSCNMSIINELIERPQFEMLCMNFPKQFKQQYADILASCVSRTVNNSKNDFWGSIVDFLSNKNAKVQSMLASAYNLDDAIGQRYPLLYIPFFLQRNQAKDAMNIVLAIPNEGDAVDLLMQHFSTKQADELTPRNTPFAHAFARKLLAIIPRDEVNIGRAIALSSQISQEFPELVIPYLLNKGLLKDAYQLIDLIKVNQPDHAVKLIVKFFTSDDHFKLIPPNTDFSLQVARHLMTERKDSFDMAMMLSYEVGAMDIERAVPYLVRKSMMEQAYKLIVLKSKTRMSDAVVMLSTHFSKSDELKFVENDKDSSLAKAFATYWVEQAKKADSFRFFSSCQYTKKECLANALRLSSSADIDNAELFFDEYFTNNEWDKAYDLYKKQPKISADKLKKLAIKYYALGEEYYNEGANNRSKFDISVPLYTKSLDAKSRAYELHKDEEYQFDVAVHKRLLAQCLFDQSCTKNDVSLSEIYGIIGILDDSRKIMPASKMDDEYLPVRFQVLEKKVMLLRDDIRQHRPDGFSMMSESECKKQYKFDRKNVTDLMNTIKEMLNLAAEIEKRVDSLAVEYTKVNPSKLAYLNYLLAELKEINDVKGELQPEILSLYKKAAELSPDNPYYARLVFETTELESNEEKVFQQLYRKLFKLKGIQSEDYRNWHKERWLKPAERLNPDLPQPESMDELADKVACSRSPVNGL